MSLREVDATGRAYQSYRQQVSVTVATRDIGQIYSRLESYIALYNVPPPSLAAVGEDQVLDPCAD